MGKAERLLLAALALALLALLAPGAATAQDYVFKPAVQWQGRADLLATTNETTALLGLGANIPAGYYVRVGLDAAVGVNARAGTVRDAARLDLTSRFLFDPFAEQRVGWYAGGGVSLLHQGSDWRPYLTVVVGREGPTAGRWRTAIEGGVGGGVRLGVVLRRARENGR